MDDKELIKKVRNSLKAKKSQAEILKGFQSRGYKLAYAEKIISKAKRPKKILLGLLVTLVVFSSLSLALYTTLSGNEKTHISNPLEGFTIVSETASQANEVSKTPSSTSGSPDNQQSETNDNQDPEKEVSYDEIEITPDFISFLLNEIGAWQLHKNPLTFQKPIINFNIDGTNFYSEIDDEIQTYEGLSESADLQFNTNKKDIIDAVMSETPDQIFKNSVTDGRTQIELKASEAELFAKGYLKLYDSLK